MDTKSGKIIVLAGPSGVGKGSIGSALLAHFPEMRFSVSVTTRPRREYEVEGKHYFFVSKETFFEKIKGNEFVEFEEVYKNGHMYGTLISYIESAISQGKILLLDMEAVGGLKVKNFNTQETLAIFIKFPNEKTQLERLKKRGSDSEEQIKYRMERLPRELSLAEKYDKIIINNDLQESIEQVIKLVESF